MLNTAKEVTIEQVYGKLLNDLKVLLTGRQEFTSFDMLPAQPVKFLTLDGRIKTHDTTTDHKFGGPRLIIEDRKIRRVVFVETGEARPAVAGEFWLTADGNVNTFASNLPVPIAVRTIEEVQ